MIRVIFYVLFNTGTSMHDSFSSFDTNEPEHIVKAFSDWVMEKRKEIEVKTGKSVVVQNIKLIR